MSEISEPKFPVSFRWLNGPWIRIGNQGKIFTLVVSVRIPVIWFRLFGYGLSIRYLNKELTMKWLRRKGYWPDV